MKHIITSAIAIIFVVTLLFAIFNTGKLINTGFNYVLDTGYCDYHVASPSKPVEEVCGFNADKAKKDTAESAAIVLATLPVAIFTYRKIKTLI